MPSIKTKLNVKFFLCLNKLHDMRSWVGGGIALCILTLGTSWRLVVSCMFWLLYIQGKCFPLWRESRVYPEVSLCAV
jgi:hypothetical protein